jgi:predicted phosphodiesterase
MKKTVNSVGAHYNVDVLNIVRLYEERLSEAKIASTIGLTLQPLRTILAALNLRKPKKYRANDARIFWERYNGTPEDEVTHKMRDDLEFAQYEVSKLYKEVTRQRRITNTLRAGLRKEAEKDTLEEKILEEVGDWLETPVVTYPAIKPLAGTTHNEGLVLVLSDLHIGEIVEASQTSGNGYNYAIMRSRVNALLSELLAYPYQSDKITVLSLGDQLVGQIHNANAENGLMNSLLEAVDVFKHILRVLSDMYKQVDFYSVTGNHERLTEKPHSNINKHLDYNYLFEEMLQRATSYDNVSFYSTRTGYLSLKINGANIFAFHGDTLRSYAPSNATQRSHLQDICINMTGNPYKFAISGHTHQFQYCANQYGGANIVNGTMVGSNHYGTNNGMRDINASQTILFIDNNAKLRSVQEVIL